MNIYVVNATGYSVCPVSSQHVCIYERLDTHSQYTPRWNLRHLYKIDLRRVRSRQCHQPNLKLYTITEVDINSRFHCYISQHAHTHMFSGCRESLQSIWDPAAIQIYNKHTRKDRIMTAFHRLRHKQINANSSWHLSDKVKDLHISGDAHLTGQVAQHYWYGVHKAKRDKCN